jgi:hypothetical protein
MLMDTLKPVGEIRSPAEDPAVANTLAAGSYGSPQARAEWAIVILWHNLQTVKPKRLTQEMFSIPFMADELAEMERTAYSMAQARDDLQIEFRGPSLHHDWLTPHVSGGIRAGTGS